MKIFNLQHFMNEYILNRSCIRRQVKMALDKGVDYALRLLIINNSHNNFQIVV